MIKKIPWQSIVLAVIIFLFFLNPPSDFDFGWHIQYGAYFWNHGQVLWENIFSSTFPLFRWVNHSWLYDILIYPVFIFTGFLGIALSGPILIFIALKIIFKTVKALPIEQLFGAAVLSFFGLYSLGMGVRSRYPSFIFLAVVYWIIEKGRQKFYFFYLLPPLFILWANLHGTYTEGLLFLGLTWLVGIYDVIREPKKYLYLWCAIGGIGVVTILASFLNPFGPAVLQEAFTHLNSPYRRLVLEYAPLLDLKNPLGLMMILYSLLIALGLWWNRKKEYILEAVVLLPFLYLSFDSIRNMAVFVLLSIPLIIKLYRPITLKITASKIYLTIFPLVLLMVLTSLFFRLWPLNLLNYSWDDYCRFSTHCSVQSVQYLKSHPPKGQGFNFYDWGGFMIWQIPEVKPFIDGRMHLWHEGDSYIMNTYMQILKTEGDWEKAFNAFNFSWAIVPPGWPIVQKFDLMVKDGKWERVYWDQNAIIYYKL